MIDVHITTHKCDDKERLQKCIKSVEQDKRVNVFVHPFDDRGVGYARLEALKSGNSEFFAFVDPDDYVEPGSFDRGEKLLKEGNYSAYFTNHWILKNDEKIRKWFLKLREGGCTQESLMHHLVIYRRDVVEPVLSYMPNVMTNDIRLFNLQSILHGKVLGEDYCGYYWRCDAGQNHMKYNAKKNNPLEWHEKVKSLRQEILDNR